MKRLFIYSIALMSVFALPFTSCSDDDDDDNKKEVSNQTNAQTLGANSQAIIEKLGDGSEDALIASVIGMSKSEVLQAAKVLVEFDKNKNDLTWVKQFTEAAATEKISADMVKNMLTDAVGKLSEIGMIGDGITADDLAAMIEEFKNSGNGNSVSGTEDGNLYKAFFTDNKDILLALSSGDMTALNKLSNEAQAKMFAVMSLYNTNKSNSTWLNDFFAAATPGYSAEEIAQLKKAFDTYSSMVSTLPED